MPPDNSADADLTPASLVFPTIFEGFFTCPSYPAFRVRGSPSSPSTRCLHAGLPPSLEGPSPASLSKGSPPGSPGWHSFPWPALWLPWASCEVDALPTPCGRHPGTASPIFYGKGTQEMNTLAPNCGCWGTGRACGERVWSGHPTRSLTLMPQPGQPCTVAKPPPAGHGPSQPGTARSSPRFPEPPCGRAFPCAIRISPAVTAQHSEINRKVTDSSGKGRRGQGRPAESSGVWEGLFFPPELAPNSPRHASNEEPEFGFHGGQTRRT